jgi:GH35 family endo-1,4-beta-xylanase
MNQLSRRDFLKTSALGAAALGISPLLSGWPSVFAKTGSELVFRPYPHPLMPVMPLVYATDENDDPFKSAIQTRQDGIVVPEDLGNRKFAVNTRWYVEGFGYVWLGADNGGAYYSRDDFGNGRNFNLNYEFARTRVSRNKKVLARYQKEGTIFSSEVKHLAALSEELLNEAAKKLNDGERCAKLSDKALHYALWAGEKIELEKAKSDIDKMAWRDQVYFGCESRQYIWAKHEEFTKRFVELFNYATVTHYVWDTWYELFEPREGQYNWGVKDDIVNWLSENNIRIEGRPLFWFHPAVTPDWLKNKNFDELKKYIEKHTHDLVSHYGDKVLEWEVVNEYHDWANIHNHTPEQITEIVRLACDKTKEANPKVVRILNNCCPFAEYVARGRMARMEATRPLRSPRQFIKDLIDANVEFDVLGIQIYFPQRDLSDIVRLLERLAVFGKPIYLTEIGASSNLPPVNPDAGGVAKEPYAWHRHWDEELQADWLEQVYTIYYSKPFVKAINWYDFSDFRPYIVNGGLVREDCSTKLSFQRLKNLLASWNRFAISLEP